MKSLCAGLLALALAGCAAYADPQYDAFSRVHPGMTRDATRAAVGAPFETMRFPRLGSESWDYRAQDTWGYLVLVSVMFGPDGTVTGVSAQRLNDGGDHGT